MPGANAHVLRVNARMAARTQFSIARDLKYFVLIVTFVVAFSAGAKGKGKNRHRGRQPASGFQSLVVLTEQNGHRVRFEVKMKEGHYTVLMGKATGERVLRQLDPDQVDDLDDDFNDLPTTEKLPPECAHARVDITLADAAGSRHKESCLGKPSITEPAYRRFVNSLDSAF